MADLPKGQGVFMPPFKSWLASNIPAVYDNTMTYYEELCALIKYLETQVVPALNHNAAAVTTISKALEQLKQYVDHYFENLDVQEEIDKKLDEMVEDGTLDDIIAEYFSNEAKYVFPGRWGSDSTSGNSNLVLVDGKALLFDTNQSALYANLKAMLTEHDVTHLDYVFISHFDGDHMGNFVNLVNDGYIDSNTKYYHGVYSNVVYSSSINYDTVEACCTANNITSIVPTNFSTITDGDISLKFGNTDLTYIENNYTNANDASMVVILTHNNVSSMYTGDCLVNAQRYLHDNEFVDRDIALYTVCHHGIEKPCYMPFIKDVNPKVAFAQTQMQDFRKNKLSRNRETSMLASLGAKVYYSFAQYANPVFYENYGSINCVNAIPYGGVGFNPDMGRGTMYYVDSTSENTVQNGTAEYPFHDLPSALGIIGKNDVDYVQIKLASGTYGTLNTADAEKNISLFAYNPAIYIDSDPGDTAIINGIQVFNANVRIKNVTIDVPAYNSIGALIEESKVIFEDCSFTNSGSIADAIGVEVGLNSNVVLDNCSFDNLTDAVHGTSGTATVQNINSNDTTNLFRISDNFNITVNSYGTLTNLTKVFSNSFGGRVVKSKTQAVTMTDCLNEITLDHDNTAYNMLEIFWNGFWNGSNFGKCSSLVRYENNTGLLVNGNAMRAGDSAVYIFGAVATISGNKLTFTRNGVSKTETSSTTFRNGTSGTMTDGIKVASIRFFNA